MNIALAIGLLVVAILVLVYAYSAKSGFALGTDTKKKAWQDAAKRPKINFEYEQTLTYAAKFKDYMDKKLTREELESAKERFYRMAIDAYAGDAAVKVLVDHIKKNDPALAAKYPDATPSDGNYKLVQYIMEEAKRRAAAQPADSTALGKVLKAVRGKITAAPA